MKKEAEVSGQRCRSAYRKREIKRMKMEGKI
jgi:hypothetical protein